MGRAKTKYINKISTKLNNVDFVEEEPLATLQTLKHNTELKLNMSKILNVLVGMSDCPS